ncbi:ATP-binding protein [Patescibacteria group bacterium]|nr:ATP-binding protein [Patescibacteria group bacterium]MBU1663660.1 ATP-binding protein [Patescibacteria group bacterium]MBU1934138.1 ATP-binding protein [Patescibacteria group bacterium]MBU2007569.1 ATP-binding protein [Patescibacteria group bacterium]MBU2233544.1 ATP-binding protein [Patescibacteria group bacterium]
MAQKQINQYIQNQLSRAPFLLRSLTHDGDGNPYLARNIFIQIEKYINDFIAGKKEVRIIGIPGLRGAGKTTLLAQLFFKLFPQHQRELLYISVDQIVNILRSDLYSALEEYQKILGESFERLDKNIFIFIDEIHFDKNWPSVLKSIYDKSKNVFVICTGSSAISLQSTTDIARRIIFEKLYPMNFEEYIMLKTNCLASQKTEIKTKFPMKELKEKIKNALFYSKSADACYANLNNIQKDVKKYWLDVDQLEINKYLKFDTMPFALCIDDENKSHALMNELIDRVIEKDLFELNKFSVETIEKIKNILLMVASSDEISITSLAKNLTDISKNTLIDIFSALEKAEMIIRVYPYGSVYKKVRKPSKYYFMTPAIRYALLSIVDGASAFEKYKGKYLEDIAALYLRKEFGRNLISPIYYDSTKGGADFILQIGDKKIVLEIGFGNKKTQQAETSLEKTQGNYGLVISKSNFEFLRDKNIIKVPLEFFLLI